MLIKTLLIASSLMVADGRQMLRNQGERTLGGWAGDGNTAVPVKVAKKPTKGSGKKTLVMRKKRKSTSKTSGIKKVKPANIKPSQIKVIKAKESKGKPANFKPAKIVNKKWGDDGFAPLVTPKPTRKPTQKWGDDGFEPIETPKPTRKPIGKWGDDGFEPIETPKPTRKPTNKWGNDGHCMYRANADSSMCTNDDGVSADVIYSSLNRCCKALFGTYECDYEDVCSPCEEQMFFFDGDKCVNDVYFADAPAYNTAVACCNLNFGIGSFSNGNCDYVDVCKPEPISPSPTPCEEMVFFLDGNTCTNDIFIADAVSYTNPIICCNVNFGPGSITNGDCNVVDICNPTPNPTKRPTPKPTPNPVTPSPTPCEEMVFFVDGNTCTNDIYVADAMSYSSAVACCNMNFGVGSMNNGCNVVDICNPTPAPTPCEDKMFFYEGSVCSNEIYIADTAAYATVVACCNVNFGIGSYENEKCDYTDECNPQPAKTPEPSPAPTTCEERNWYIGSGGGYTICSNGYDFSSNSVFFASLSECCEALGTTCYYEDVCATPSPSYSPTVAATFGSTPTVSKETTGPPTMVAGRGD